MEDNHLLDQLLNMLDTADMYSDFLLESGGPIMVRGYEGWGESPMTEIPSKEIIGKFIENLDPLWRENILKGAINRPLSLHNCRLRVNAYMAAGGTKLMAAIRRIPKAPPTIQQLGLPNGIRLLLENPKGIILISGATGAGKTTTMAAMVDMINEMRRAHIVTIEDPIEFVFERKNSIFSQREIGIDCASFADGVKDAMRQRPNVIVIGEIRDRETAEQALLAGESGHLVIGTFHASSACGTISKMLGFFGGDERASKLQILSESLVGVINQSLIPKVSKDGYALAVDFLANHKRQYSKVLGEIDKVQSLLSRAEDGVSISLGQSIINLVSSGAVNISDVGKVVYGNSIVYDRIRQFQSGS
ncbi:MAG TPA: type II secretion system protein E [Rhodospirillaceae bacterium]|nr:type II secretion system protein E [Rhodospirillaceae bacterium]